ncbi:MAG TPA: glycoside hydrolase family 19 protein [Rhodocyclaceae bacterium]
MLTVSLLMKIYGCKAEKAERWLPYLQSATRFADVDRDPNRLSCFLAQIGHESGRLRYTREIWGPTAQQRRYEYGTPLARTLGNFEPGDGKRYLGRGLIQITGRMNYRVMTQQMSTAVEAEYSGEGSPIDVPDFEESPEALERPFWAAMSAALFWRQRRLNTFADAHDFVTMTRRINGGINGLADRQALYGAALGALI